MWDCCISQNRLIVTKYVRWLDTRNPQHSKFVPQSTNIFSALLHGSKLQSKRTRRDSCLFLRSCAAATVYPWCKVSAQVEGRSEGITILPCSWPVYISYQHALQEHAA